MPEGVNILENLDDGVNILEIEPEVIPDEGHYEGWIKPTIKELGEVAQSPFQTGAAVGTGM
jgi:hypothetical protein